MHSALFIATIPQKDQDWADFVQLAEQKSPQFEGSARLAVNVWLLDARKAIGFLGFLIGKAEAKGIEYGVLALEDEPQWLPAGFSPTSIPNQ